MRNPQSKESGQHHAIMAAIEHELRNPLAAITFSLDSLKQTETLSDSGLRMLEIASRQTQFAAQVLETIADIFQLQSESDSTPWQPVDVNEVVTESCHSLAPALASKRQHLHQKLAAAAIISRGDPIRLQQAITNLLDNASKHTPSGGDIWIETIQTDDEVIIVVRDSGSGIAPAIREKIFDLFFSGSRDTNSVGWTFLSDHPAESDGEVPPADRQTSSEQTLSDNLPQESIANTSLEETSPAAHLARPKPGMGIGLFLVQQIALQHGGSIEVIMPASGHGSEFRLTLSSKHQETFNAKSISK